MIATHLSHIVQAHAHELLGHEEVQQLLNTLAKTAPKLVEDLVPKLLPLSTVVRVLQGLLAERVPIRNMRTIVETLAEHAPRTQDPPCCRAHVRVALGRQIVQDIAGLAPSCPSSHSSPSSNNCCRVRSPATPPTPVWSPVWQSACNASRGGRAGVRKWPVSRQCCSCRRQLRHTLARFMRSSVPSLHVLAWNEIPDNRKVRLVRRWVR